MSNYFYFIKMQRLQENYLQLIWTLAKTDFKLRYHGSFLGYIWAVLKPLLMFLILNFVFSSVFNPKNTGTEYYSIQLIVSIILFNFFGEGTMAGLGSLIQKSALVTKIYVPRWTIIVASTLNSLMVFLMNIFVVIIFFIWYGFLPSGLAILNFILFIVLTYLIILGFAFIAAPLFVKFRDLSQIWEVLVSALFYASPIVYPLSILSDEYRKIILFNPMAYIIHFNKTALVEGRFAPAGDLAIFVVIVVLFFASSLLVYKKMEAKIAENI